MTFELHGVGRGQDSEQRDSRVDESWHLTVSRSDWIERLSRSGARDILLVEVPLPFRREDGRSSAAALREAEKRYGYGDYRGCVQACRDAVQELGEEKYGTKSWSDDALKQLGNGPRGMDKEERQRAFWAAVRHYTHLAHHSEGEGGERNYSRAEAQMMLVVRATIARSIVE